MAMIDEVRLKPLGAPLKKNCLTVICMSADCV
jgi:hypothetical protein